MFYTAGIQSESSPSLAWEEEHVEKIIRKYVGRAAATKALIDQLNRGGRVRSTQKPAAENSQAKWAVSNRGSNGLRQSARQPVKLPLEPGQEREAAMRV